jgi:hypothetical protein
MKKIIKFIPDQGHLIMLVGLVILVTGIYFHYRIYRGVSQNIMLAWGVSGFGIFAYVLGRIGVYIKASQKKRIK